MRRADGTIVRVRIEESTHQTSKAEATRVAADIAAHYHEQAYRPTPKTVSFTDAAITYAESGGKDKRFLRKLVAYFGETPISAIDQQAALPCCFASSRLKASSPIPAIRARSWDNSAAPLSSALEPA